MCVAALLSAVLFSHASYAEEPDVPVGVQVQLLAKVVSYDRAFEARAPEPALVLVVQHKDSADSARVAASLVAELERQPLLGSRKHRDEVVLYAGPDALASACRARGADIVYITPGLESEARRIADALDGIGVLSVAAVARYVERGIVLGFDVLSGKPKIVVHRERAKRQQVAFRADLLRLARVVE